VNSPDLVPAGGPSLTAELPSLRRRQRRCLVASLLWHALLFCWLVLLRPDATEPLGMVEISWLEPEPAAPVVKAPPPATKPKPAKQEEKPAPASAAERPAVQFRRELKRAPVEPQPQNPTALKDRLDERLAALRKQESRPGLLAASEPTSRWSAAAPAAPAAAMGTPSAAPRELTREQGPAGDPLSLRREPTPSRRPALAALPPVPENEPAPAASETPTAARTLEGVTLTGPIANRPVVSHPMPVYPEWAMREAVEATVTLSFVVLPDGRVKENVQLQKTGGYSDFDDNAVAALRRWRFAALPAGTTEEQWGTITFRYRLRDSR
jgi:TonB family protein